MFLLNSILSKRAQKLISYICCFQMVFAPLATQAQQIEASRQPASTVASSTKSISQPFTKEDMDGFLRATGLNNKNLTVGEFYKKLSQFVPQEALKDFAPWFRQNSKVKMPKVTVSTFKDKDSQTKYRLTLSQGKIVRTFTFYGETENIIQYGNMPMAQADIFSVSDVAKKIYAVDRHARDPKVEEQVNYRAMTWREVPQDPNQYSGSFVLPTYEHYKKMTPYQRAEFIVRTQELWVAAKQAEFLLNKKKTNSVEAYRYNDFFVQALIGQVAEAKVINTSGKKFYTGTNGECIDSGYVGEFKKNANGSLSCVSTADSFKEQDKIAYGSKCVSMCNPMIYGLQANGQAYCSDSRANRQIATHWEGSCDKASRLSDNKYIEDLKVNPNDPSSMEDLTNQLQGKETEIKAKTERLLASLMNEKSLGDKLSDTDLVKFFKGESTPEEFQKRFNVAVTSFYQEITTALNACSTFEFDKELLNKKKVTANDDGSQQLNACRQLWRRKLVFDVGLGQICKSAAKSQKSETGCVGFEPKSELVASCDGEATRVETRDPQPLSTPNPKFNSTIRDRLDVGSKPERSQPAPQVTVKCKCSTGAYVDRSEKCGAGAVADSSNLTPGRCGVPDDQVKPGESNCICKSTGFEPRVVSGKKTCEKNVASEFDEDTKCLSGQGAMVWMSCNKNWLVPIGTALLVGGALWWLKSRAKAKDKATDVCPSGWQTCPGQYGTVGTACTAPATWSVTLQKCYLPCGPNEVPNLTTNPTKCDPVSTVVSKMNSYACWNGQTVANEILCPKYECPDGSRVANPTACSNSGNQKLQKSIYEIEK